MRHTDAWSRWQFHEMPMSTPSAQATADFIGDTWLTTTTLIARPARRAPRTRAHPVVERGERFAALGDVVRVLLPARPHPGWHVGVRHAFVLAIGQFDPPLVDLVRASRSARPSAARASGAGDHGVDRRFGQHECGDGDGLALAELVEILVEPTLQQPCCVGRRSTVTHEDQHAAERATPASCAGLSRAACGRVQVRPS